MGTLSSAEMCAYIATLLSRKRNYLQELREEIKRYPYVVFYGCGIILSGIIENWNSYIGRNIDYCCDRDPNKWGKFFFGAKCLSPSELMAIKNKCAVFVTVGDFKPVYDFLKINGFPSVNQIYKYDLATGEFLPHIDKKKIIKKLCETYEILDDKQSKNVFSAIVTRVLGDGRNVDIMLDICQKNQYFPPGIIKLSDHERLVDIGAFDGDTIRDFVWRTQGKFDQIFSFELDAVIFRQLKKNVRIMPERDRIKTFNLGIWDREDKIKYRVGNADSKIGEGETYGDVVSLDDFLRGEKVTFIKMDIEGAEPQALRGAKNLLISQMPKLAICVYHDFRHLWEIPLYIKSIVPGYKIFLRHHNSMEYETVCYAVK